MEKKLTLALVVYVAFVFIQSLFFKFTGSEETVIIFSIIGTWMTGISFLAPIAELFSRYGGLFIGTAELIAVILIVKPKTRLWGASLGFGVMSGAIFFHLFTPLGVNRIIDSAGNNDGGVLFYMACGVWLSCLTLIHINRGQLWFIIKD